MTLLLLLQSVERTLLNTARVVVKDGHPGPAVVVAETAVEVAMEASIGQHLASSGTSAGLREWITAPGALGRSYSPKSKRIQGLWTAVTGDEFQRAPWWSDYLKLVDARNEFVHSAMPPGDDAAVSAMLEVAATAVEHILVTEPPR
jgi:hypothetical protein